MGSRPQELRTEIEQTREQMAYDVDRLAEHTSPTRVARRRWEGVKGRARSVTDRVMGARDSARDSVQGAASSAGDKVQDSAHGVAATVREAPQTVARQTSGNPLAAGIIAFGVGLLAASLLPETDAEKRAGSAVAEHTGDLTDKAKQTARDAAGTTAQQAKESGRSTVEQTRQSVS